MGFDFLQLCHTFFIHVSCPSWMKSWFSLNSYYIPVIHVVFKGKTTLFVTDLRFQKILHRTTEDFCKAKNSLRTGFVDILVALFVHLN